MSDKKRGVVAGLGGRGLHWVNQAKQHSGCELVGFVEPAETMRERAIANHGIAAERIFPTLEAALQAVSPDFLIDVTPPAAHRATAETAFAHGVAVLGEKPLSDTWEDAVAAVEAGEAAKCVHMITQNYRFAGMPRTTRRLLDAGLIGKAGQVDLRFYMNWADIPDSHYVNGEYMVINDMMVHHFDMLRYVLNEEPKQVHAITWNQPWGWHVGDSCHAIVFKYASGLVATHVTVGCAVGSRTTYNGDWRIEGPQGTIDWIGNKMVHSHLHRTANPVEETLFADSVKGSERAILDEFFAAMEEKREPECSGRDNLKSLAMVFGAIRSAKEKREVRLAEFSE